MGYRDLGQDWLVDKKKNLHAKRIVCYRNDAADAFGSLDLPTPMNLDAFAQKVDLSISYDVPKTRFRISMIGENFYIRVKQ